MKGWGCSEKLLVRWCILKSFLVGIIFLIVGTGCVKLEQGELIECSAGEKFHPLTRSCIMGYNSLAPFGVDTAIMLKEDIVGLVTLDYTGDSSGGIATVCEIDPATLVNVAQVKSCSCSAGVCTVGLVGFPNATRGTFLYRFQDRRGEWGDYQSTAVTMTPVNDPPTFCPVSLASEALDNCENLVTGEDRDCMAMGNPQSYTLGLSPDFDFPDQLNRDNVNFYDQANELCYSSDMATNSWRQRDNYRCVVTRDHRGEDSANCSSGREKLCQGATAPVVDGHQKRGAVYFATDTQSCYYFEGSRWQDITRVYQQVIGVDEDTAINLFSLLQVAYDVEDGQLDFQTRHSFSDLVAQGGESLQGELVDCPGPNCSYRPGQDLNVGYDGKVLSSSATGIDKVTLRAEDSEGLMAESSVAFIVRELNDVPLLSRGRDTLPEGLIYRQTLTLTNDRAGEGTWGNIVDYDERAGLKNFVFLSDATDPTGESECLSGKSIMSDLTNGGGSGLAPFNGAGDDLIFCDTGKGVARASFSSGNSSSSFRTVELSFFPNLNFTGSVTIAFTLQDSEGGQSGSGALTLTYTPVNDAPTACLYSEVGHGDCGFLGVGGSDHSGVACLWNEPPSSLSQVLDTSVNNHSLYPNHGGVPQALALVGGAIFYDQRNDDCYISVGAQGWKAKGVQSCVYSLDAEDEADDCGGGRDCVGNNLPAALPTTSGLVFYDDDDFNCYVSDQGVGWQLATGSHWVFKVDENMIEGTHEVVVDTTTMAKDPDGDLLSYEVSSPPSKGALTDCPGANCRYRPHDLESGFDSFTLRVRDGTEAEDIVVGLAIRDVNTPPVLTYAGGKALHETRLIVNEGGVVQIFDLVVDEGAWGTGEDVQSLSFDISSSNPVLLPTDGIQVFFGDRSIFYDTINRSDLHRDASPNSFDSLGDSTQDSATSSLGLRFETLPGKRGETTISLTLRDDGSPAASVTIEFTLEVRGLGVSFQDWDNVFAVGPLLRKSADIKDCDETTERSTSRYCGGGSVAQDCVGALNPNTDLTTYLPSHDGLVFFDRSSQTCFESDGEKKLWVPRGCFFSRSQTYCGGGDCVGRGPPSGQTGYPSPPSVSGLRYSDVETGLCYTSLEGQGWVPEGSYVELDWKSFTPQGEAIISGYRVFRRTRDFEYNYSEPVAVIDSATRTHYTDVIGLYDIPGRVPREGQVLFYKVLPVDGTNGQLVFPQESYSEIAVVLPPYNMVMVPRRIVNANICQSLQETPDASQNNRCAYTGLVKESATSDYFQLTYDLIIDRFEYGCNYTSSVGANGSCGTNTSSQNLPCYGNQLPTSSSVVNSIFYNRSTGRCHVNGGASWSNVDGAASAQLKVVGEGGEGRLADLAPLTHISQQKAQAICANRTSAAKPILLRNDSRDMTIGDSTFRLPSRLEQVALTSWDNGRYSHTDISALEQGKDMSTSPKCNSSRADGVSEFSDADLVLTTAIHTLPGTSSSNILSMATGSDVMSQCASRYQVRSLVGNVREWSDEQFSCNSAGGCTGGQGVYKGSVSGANVMGAANSYAFDGTTGPSVLNGFASWELGEESNDATFFDFPVALPFSLDSSTISFEIGRTSGVSVSQLHSDTFTVLETSVSDAGILYGGGYEDGLGAGRYYGRLESSDTLNSETGFRCFLPLNPGY